MKIFYCFIASFILNLGLYSQEKYFFNIEKEGIYEIKLPENYNDEFLLTQHKKGNSLVYQIIDGYAYMYCPVKGNYQIGLSDKLYDNKVKISPYKILSEKNHYQYSLPNSLNTKHWLHQIVSEKKSYKVAIKKGISLSPRKENITFNLYNFNKSKTPIIIKINGKEKHFTLPEMGDHRISVSYYSDEKKVEIEEQEIYDNIRSLLEKLDSYQNVLSTAL